MKKLKAILSIAVMALLITSTLGFSVSRHYCMGMLVEESFFHFADDCGMEVDEHCKDSNDIHLKKNCCQDESLVIAGIDVLSFANDHLQLNLPFFGVPAPQHFSFKLSLPDSPEQFLTHSPPDISPSGQEILILEQRFLI